VATHIMQCAKWVTSTIVHACVQRAPHAPQFDDRARLPAIGEWEASLTVCWGDAQVTQVLQRAENTIPPPSTVSTRTGQAILKRVSSAATRQRQVLHVAAHVNPFPDIHDCVTVSVVA
jgi:hypothetical protein